MQILQYRSRYFAVVSVRKRVYGKTHMVISRHIIYGSSGTYFWKILILHPVSLLPDMPRDGGAANSVKFIR